MSEGMPFVKIAAKKGVEPSKMLGVETNGQKILLANLDGAYYAMGNTCTHMGCMLSDGDLIGEKVKCACHGSEFSLKTGSVVKGPAKKPEPTYLVKIEGDQIMVDV
jgi:nitrite reductase/ring-hydroxylating ferredoxin subunit